LIAIGQELDFIVVVVIAEEVEELGRDGESRGDGYLQLPALFQPADFLALAIEQVVGDVFLDAHVNAVNVLAVGGKLNHAHDVDAHALARLHLTAAMAGRAILVNAALERWTNALPGHLDDTE